MNRLPIIFSLMTMLLSATAQADELTLCRLTAWDGKAEVKCRVRLLEGDRARTEEVSLSVDCSNGLEIDDDRAQQFDRGEDEYNVADKRGTLAVLKIKDEARSEEGKRAVLLIGEDEDALRAEGRCFLKRD